MKIHPTAVIEEGAKIGEGTEIGPYAVIYRHAEIGSNCRIHAGAVIGDTPQDLAFKDVSSRVRIGANCVIREHVTIHRGTKEGSETVVGSDCYLMANSHLAHNVRLGDRVILANGVALAGYVEVGDRAFISGNATAHQFVRIGRLAMVGGLSGSSKDVPPFCMAASVSFSVVAGLNVVGMRRAGFSPEERRTVKEIFNLLYRAGLNTTQAVHEIQQKFPDGLGAEFVEFIRASKRGICAYVGRGGDSNIDE